MTPASTALAQTLLLLTQSLCVSTGFICPNLSYLDSFVQLICTGGSDVHRYTNSSGGDVARCVLIEGRPCQPENASVSVINSTQTVLNISGIETTDAGTWSCENTLNHHETCNMTVAKTPTCSITSKGDTDVLAQYQALTLTVDIQDYYCSTALTFSLQTGNVTTLLMAADSVANITHNTSSVTLDVTDSHLGFVRLMFNCHKNKWNLTCDGVTALLPKTPTCNITSDKDTETLTMYEEVTLTVDISSYNDIRGSYCSVDSDFTLQTGDVTQLLNVAESGTGRDLSPITFKVTQTRLGDVRLIFNCQHKHWNLTCEGVGELNNKTKRAAVAENDGLATSSTPIIAASIVGAIVFLIIVITIIVFVVKRKQVAGSADTHTYANGNVTGVTGAAGRGFASSNGQQGPGLRINPVYIPTTVGGSLELYSTTVTAGIPTATGEMGGNYLHPEARGEYVALDRNLDQPSNSYEHLRIYEQIANT